MAAAQAQADAAAAAATERAGSASAAEAAYSRAEAALAAAMQTAQARTPPWCTLAWLLIIDVCCILHLTSCRSLSVYHRDTEYDLHAARKCALSPRSH